MEMSNKGKDIKYKLMGLAPEKRKKKSSNQDQVRSVS